MYHQSLLSKKHWSLNTTILLMNQNPNYIPENSKTTKTLSVNILWLFRDGKAAANGNHGVPVSTKIWQLMKCGNWIFNLFALPVVCKQMFWTVQGNQLWRVSCWVHLQSVLTLFQLCSAAVCNHGSELPAAGRRSCAKGRLMVMGGFWARCFKRLF